MKTLQLKVFVWPNLDNVNDNSQTLALRAL